MQWSNKKNDTIFLLFYFFSFCFLVIIVAAYTSALCSADVCMSVRKVEKTAAQLFKCSRRKVCMYVFTLITWTLTFSPLPVNDREENKTRGKLRLGIWDRCWDWELQRVEICEKKLISDSPFTMRCSFFSNSHAGRSLTIAAVVLFKRWLIRLRMDHEQYWPLSWVLSGVDCIDSRHHLRFTKYSTK